MRLYVDSAEREAVERALGSGYVYGVTTNPTLLRRAGLTRSDLPSLVHAAAQAGAREIHLQVFADTPAGIRRDGVWLRALDPARVIVKVPATAAGFAAAPRLAEAGVPVTITAVYTVAQLLISVATGARYAAVYVGRMQDAGGDALERVGAMLDVLRVQNSDLRLLAASLRTPADLEALARVGVPAATMPLPLLLALPESAQTAEAMQAFQEDAARI